MYIFIQGNVVVLRYLQSRLCKKCGSLLSPLVVKPPTATVPNSTQLSTTESQSRWKCQMCSDGGHIEVVSVPYVFRYLIAELAAMNIRVKIQTS